MFVKSASFYDRMYRFYDYDARFAEYLQLIRDRCPQARSFLDVGCGTGKYLERFARHFDSHGIDLEPTMVAIAAERCSNSRVSVGDMRDFHLGRQFDVVACLFRSIGYVRSVDGLRAAVATMASHVSPGGLLLVEPWFTPSQFWCDHLTMNVTEDDEGKLVWMYTSKRSGDVGTLDIHFLVGTGESVTHFTERHELGLFTDAQYEEAIAATGLQLLERPAGAAQGAYVARRGELPR